jgi:hypothetical protein
MDRANVRKNLFLKPQRHAAPVKCGVTSLPIMCTKFMRLFAIGAVLHATTRLGAQVSPVVETKPSDTVSSAEALVTGLKLREEAATAASTGTEKPDSIIVRLKAHPSPSGLGIVHDADFAIAAIDIGQRLIAKGKYAEAEKFFQEAEAALVGLVAKTSDESARDKAMFLQHLALIRAEYLNKRVQAKEDIASAIRLQPDEKYFQGFRDYLAIDQGKPGTAAANPTKNGE